MKTYLKASDIALPFAKFQGPDTTLVHASLLGFYLQHTAHICQLTLSAGAPSSCNNRDIYMVGYDFQSNMFYGNSGTHVYRPKIQNASGEMNPQIILGAQI
jgi:hypothetical protein